MSIKIEGYLSKTLKYLPYKYSVFFKDPIRISKKNLTTKDRYSDKIYDLIKTTEQRSALDYSYWEIKLAYKVNHRSKYSLKK